MRTGLGSQDADEVPLAERMKQDSPGKQEIDIRLVC